jgi:hypothetical protein
MLPIFVSLIFKLSPLCFAQPIPSTSFQLNPKYNLKLNEAQSQNGGASGFNSVFEGADFEVHARGTRITDEKAARKMAEVELAGIRRLYEPRRNPYEGQITEVVQCDKNLRPRYFSFKVGGQKVDAILAGANSRKIFGVCARDQLDFWGGYFNFYDKASQLVLEFRIFAKAQGTKSAEHLKAVSENLLQSSAKR